MKTTRKNVQNKDTILKEIDDALQVEKPPSIEYIFVQPFSQFHLPLPFSKKKYGFHFNTFGHSAVRYTLDDNGTEGTSVTEYVMNIEAQEGSRDMVNFRDPKEFLFGDSGPQGGVHNREMVGIRIENVDREKVREMHEYFLRVQEDSRRGRNKFWIAPAIFHNFLHRLSNSLFVQYGNCARWTSKGLQKAGVVSNYTYWPKSVFIDMFENAHDRENVHVVMYHRRENNSDLKYGIDAEPVKWVAPFDTFRSLVYYDLNKFANVTVDIDTTMAQSENTSSYKAILSINSDPIRPSHIRNVVNNKIVIGSSVMLTSWGTYCAYKKVAASKQFNAWSWIDPPPWREATSWSKVKFFFRRMIK